MKQKIPVLVLSIAGLFTSILIFYMGLSEIKGALFTDIADFNTTNGLIVKSKIGYRSGKGGSYFYDIIYRYQVNGVSYESDQINFASITSSREESENYVSKYAVGKEVTVFFKVDNPTFSVLEPNQKSNTVYLTMFTLALFIVSVFGLLRCIVRGRRKMSGIQVDRR